MAKLDGCIAWYSQVLIPPQAHKHILAELYMKAFGGASMKSLAGRFFKLHC